MLCRMWLIEEFSVSQTLLTLAFNMFMYGTPTKCKPMLHSDREHIQNAIKYELLLYVEFSNTIFQIKLRPFHTDFVKYNSNKLTMTDTLTFIIKKSSYEKRPHLPVAWILKCSCEPELFIWILQIKEKIKTKMNHTELIQKSSMNRQSYKDYNDVEHFPEFSILKNTQWALDVIVTIKNYAVNRCMPSYV